MPDKVDAGAAAQPDWMPFAMPEHVLAPPVRRYVPPPRPSAPSTIAAATALMLMRAGLQVLALGALYTGRDTWRAQMLQQYPLAAPSAIDSVITTTLTTTAVSTAAFAYFYVLRAARVRAGSNRARLMTMVLAGLSITSVIYSVSRPVPTVWKAAMAVDVMLDVAIIALLTMRASARWCRPSRS